MWFMIALLTFPNRSAYFNPEFRPEATSLPESLPFPRIRESGRVERADLSCFPNPWGFGGWDASIHCHRDLYTTYPYITLESPPLEKGTSTINGQFSIALC